MIIILIALPLVILYLFECYLWQSIEFKLYRKIPALGNEKPIFGNALEAIISPQKLFYKARHVSNKFRNRGNICRAYFLNVRFVNLYEPNHIEVLLSNTKYIDKGELYFMLHRWLGEGLLTSKGEKWHKRRKILTPTFHFNILKQFCKIFVEQSNILVNDLKKEVGKDETDILSFITNFTLHSINETAMGTNLGSGKDNVSEYKNAIYEMGRVFLTRFTYFWLAYDKIYAFSSTRLKEIRLVRLLHDFTTSIIRERRLASQNTENGLKPNAFKEDEGLGIKKRMAMLDLLLKAESEGLIDESGIREEVDTFMFEGHDTTKMSLVFTLMLLANNPEVQERIVNEVDNILGDSNEQLTIEDFNKMNYLEMCIKEALRLYPSVPMIIRHLKEDMHLKDYTIPANTGIFVHIFDVHRNPNLYSNPDTFDPERFSLENSKNRHPYAYIPFSAGPRNCIGQRFALLEEKVVLSIILKNFKLEPVTRCEDVKLVCDIVLRSKDPIKIKFVPRVK